MKKMPDVRPIRAGFAWLELLLVLAVLALVLQLVPSLWTLAQRALDVGNWSRTVWFAGTCVVLAMLVGIRFAPDIYGDWRRRRERSAMEQAKKQAQQRQVEERKMLHERMEAMKRRVI
jgi:hypothetical protein